MRGQPGFFDVDERLKHLSDLGDQLEAFRVAVDFEMFDPPPKWWTPLISSKWSRKVFYGYSAPALYG
jgi:hypothetical protein